MRPRSPSVPLGLDKLYRKLLGERQRILNPPKRVHGPEDDAEQEAKRLTEINEALPHIAYVLRLVQPDWREQDAKPIRPNAGRSNLPPNGWTAAALDVLREADSPLTVAEIVMLAGQRYDIDLSTVLQRQRAHSTVSNRLRKAFSHVLTRHAGPPERFSLGD